MSSCSRQSISGIVLISDGAEDELIIPILQTLKPIVSVRRVVVKHSQSVEENYMVLGRYLRMLVFEPRYSKWAIGVPGVILLFAGSWSSREPLTWRHSPSCSSLERAFLIRGFNIDRFIAGMLSQKPYGYIRLFTIPTSILMLIVALSSGYSFMTSQAADLVTRVSDSPPLFLSYGGVLVGYYLQGSLLLMWAAIGIALSGTLMTQFLRGSSRAWRSVTGLVVLVLLVLPDGPVQQLPSHRRDELVVSSSSICARRAGGGLRRCHHPLHPPQEQASASPRRPRRLLRCRPRGCRRAMTRTRTPLTNDRTDSRA